MSRFRELTKYKNNIITDFISNKDLLKALILNSYDFLDHDLPDNLNPDKPEFDPSEIIYHYIYPYRHIPEILEEPKSLITMAFQYRPFDNAFKICAVHFYALTHKSLVPTNQGLRQDFMVSIIDEMFNQSRIIGIGKLPFYGMEDITVDSEGKWVGNSLSYRTFEFN